MYKIDILIEKHEELIESFLNRHISPSCKQLFVKFLKPHKESGCQALLLGDSHFVLFYVYRDGCLPKNLNQKLKNQSIVKVFEEESDDILDQTTSFYKLNVSSFIHMQKLMGLFDIRCTLEDSKFLEMTEIENVKECRPGNRYFGPEANDLHIKWFLGTITAFRNLFEKRNEALWTFGDRMDKEYFLRNVA